MDYLWAYGPVKRETNDKAVNNGHKTTRWSAVELIPRRKSSTTECAKTFSRNLKHPTFL